ncbi:hypothetical protein HHK36_020079 [Tetracentron sinense]|uniref:FAR1 domain-containing protein n=1 Tax=Tetracentron sinense TaxID=13715 RepID=A0A834YWI0_TETSI|nr:hypothetical protein HHK36_020079 [Tetracentron sinense]
MASTSGEGLDLVESDKGSSDETLNDHRSNEDGQLESCDSLGTINNELIPIEPSVEEGSLEPYTGMTFKSVDDVRDFYSAYATRTGFSIRTNRIRHSQRNRAVIARDYVCSREGFRAAKHTHRKDRILPPRPITREGCKAMIRVAVRDEGKWIVTKFLQEHNHKLMTHNKVSGELPMIHILSEDRSPKKATFSTYAIRMEYMQGLRWEPQLGVVSTYVEKGPDEKDKKIQDLSNELQHERERSAALQQQLHMVLNDLDEHAEYLSIRIEDIVSNVREVESEGQELSNHR